MDYAAEYKKLSGREPFVHTCHSMSPTYGYVDFLEMRIQSLEQSLNEAMTEAEKYKAECLKLTDACVKIVLQKQKLKPSPRGAGVSSLGS
jgi:hypothetical protein